MIKWVEIYSIPEGIDPEEQWRHHTEIHSKDWVKASGPLLKRYIISRVIKPWGKGEKLFHGMVESWFDSEDDFNEAADNANRMAAATGETMGDDQRSWITNVFSAFVEVKEIEIPDYD